VVAGPEMARLVDDFEKMQNPKCNKDHAECTLAKQAKFLHQMKSIVTSFEEMGNPFTNSMLAAIDTGVVMDEKCNENIRKAKDIGQFAKSD
jgi:hypothetical protein